MTKPFSIHTRAGTFTGAFSEHGLVELHFPRGRQVGKPAVSGANGNEPAFQRWLRLTEDAINGCLAGRSPKKLPPLDLSRGTDFQRRVWAVLRGIGPGRTMNYAEVAAAIGQPKAARAVGGACGANPIPLLIPCHRVLAANRRLGGFSGGLEWKRKLLAIEGVPVFA